MRANKFSCYLVSTGPNDERIARGTLISCIRKTLKQTPGSIVEITRENKPFVTYTIGEDGSLWERTPNALPGLISDRRVDLIATFAGAVQQC